jgi:hypothetical protein
LNIVFEVFDSWLKSWCEEQSKEYQKVHVVSSIEEHEQYMESLEMKFNDDYTITINSNPNFEDVHLTRYSYNMNHLLNYHEKFDVFQYHGWVESTPVTLAALQELRQLIESGFSYSHFTDGVVLQRVLQVFDNYWH